MRPAHAGELSGLEGLSQGLGLDVKPYIRGGWRQGAGTTAPMDAGLDVSCSLTPSLRAAVTINTDFAETEVDDRQVNLTRFPLVFPEKRDFFLEGSAVYAFSPASSVRPYFSRRIGLADGEPVPVTWGARLGGQLGRYDLGILQLRTSERDPQPNEDFTVARIKYNMLEQSSLGLIYTRRASHEAAGERAPPDRHTLGADLDLFTSTFLSDKNLQFEAFYVWQARYEYLATECSLRPRGDLRVGAGSIGGCCARPG